MLTSAKAEDLDAAQHLTCLELNESQATCSTPSACVLTLLRLHVWESTLTGLHPEGLAACCHLLCLSCNDGCVSAMDAANDMEGRKEYAPRLPCNLQALKALTGLTFYCRSRTTEQLQLGCLAGLPTLEDLCILCSWPMQGFVSLPACLSRLTSLSKLFIESEPSASQIRFDFAWSKLVALQHLNVSGSLRSKHALSGLLSLGRLEDVSFFNVENSDAKTTRAIGQLAYRMGVERPEIDFYCG